MAAAGLTAAAGADLPRELALKGKRHLDSGDLSSALDALTEARRWYDDSGSQPDPDLADFLALSLFNLGVRLNNGGDAPGALECFAESLELLRARPALRDPDFRSRLAAAAIDLAGFAIADGRQQDGLRVYRSLAVAFPQDARPLIGIGDAQLALGDPVAADIAYRRAQDLVPSSAEAASGRGRAALAAASRLGGGPEDRADAFQNAIDQFRLARDLAPGTPSAGRDLAEALQLGAVAAGRAGRAEAAEALRAEAEAALLGAVEQRAGDPLALLDLATFVFRSRRYEDAAALFARAESGFGDWLRARPEDLNAEAWRRGMVACRDNRAAALYNLAVDALNTARFERIGPLLGGVCGASAAWERTCDAFRRIAADRERAYQESVAINEKILVERPDSAPALLALGDLHADIGQWDEALRHYASLRRLGTDVPSLDDRIASVTQAPAVPERKLIVDVPRGRVVVTHRDPAIETDIETAVKASWLRVSGSLGEDVMRGDLHVTVHPNRRSFREQGGYRVGPRVKGNYASGRISVFATPSTGLVEWVSVITHEMAHHAIDRISAGGTPRWLNEGVARYVEGDAAVVDRRRMTGRLAAGRVPALGRLDNQLETNWSDAEVVIDFRDAALLAVEEMARRGGMEGLKRLLAVAGASGDETGVDAACLEVFGAGVAAIDEAWRARLASSGWR